MRKNEERLVTHDLELDSFPVEFDGTNLEIDTDRGDERGCPGIIAESSEET